MMRLLLAIAIVLLPNALHVSWDSVVPGLNFSNLLFLVLLAGLLVSHRDTSPLINRPGVLTAPLMALFVALIIGFFIARARQDADLIVDLTDLKNALLYPLLYFVFRGCRQDLQGTRQLIILVLVVALVAAAEAVVQGIGFGVGQFDDAKRATGPFGELGRANRAGVFYAMFLPMFAAVAVLSKRKGVRLVALGGCILLAAAILFTYSRQAYLIALIALLILLMHRSVPGTIMAGLLLVMSVGLFPDSVIERVQETRQVDATGSQVVDNSTISRFEIWDGAVEMWQEHPAGVGLNRFSTMIGDYSDHPGKDAHNTFVLMLAETGVLGLLAMLWLIWRLWGLARRLQRAAPVEDIEARALALGFKLAVISMALGNIYGSAFFEGLIMANFWVLCGLLERYSILKADAANVAIARSQPAVVPAPVSARFPLAALTTPGGARHAGNGPS